MEVRPSQPLLDCNFPKARGADVEVVIPVVQDGDGRLGEAARRSCAPSGRPKQDMRVQQQSHVSPWNIRSISESPIRSKSSGTLMRPGIKPTRLGFGVSTACSGTTFTSGLPAFAM